MLASLRRLDAESRSAACDPATMIAIKSADAFEHEAFGPQRVGSMERCAVEEQGEPRVAEFERLAEIAENGYCIGCGLCLSQSRFRAVIP